MHKYLAYEVMDRSGACAWVNFDNATNCLLGDEVANLAGRRIALYDVPRANRNRQAAHVGLVVAQGSSYFLQTY